MSVFYQDENVLLRTKMTAAARERIAPLLAEIVRQVSEAIARFCALRD